MKRRNESQNDMEYYYEVKDVGVSIYSVAMAILFFSAALASAAILRRRTGHLMKHGYGVLVLAMILAGIRLAAPLDFSFSWVIGSERIVPWIRRAFLQSLGEMAVWKLALVLWGIGSILYLAAGIGLFVRELRTMRDSTPVESDQVRRVLREMHLKGAVVIVSREIDVPKVIGFRKAYICLPELFVSDEELREILRHEYEHYRGGDFFIKLLYLVLSALLWWNPVIHLFRKELDRILELRCDARVTRGMNERQRAGYAEAILHVMRQTTKQQNLFKEKAGTLFRKTRGKFIRQRFELMLCEKTSAKRKAIPYLAAVIVFVLSYFVIIQPEYHEIPVEDQKGEILISKENAFILQKKDGTMEMWVNGEKAFEVGEEDLFCPPGSELEIVEEE